MPNGGSGNAVVVAEAQWDCGNAMMGVETQNGSGRLFGYVIQS